MNLSTGESPAPAVTRLSELSASRGDAETGGTFAGGARLSGFFPRKSQRSRTTSGKSLDAKRFVVLSARGSLANKDRVLFLNRHIALEV